MLDYAICEKAKDYMPLRQLAEAIGLVRQHAAQWHILPEKIAVCGFSAGGHLALSGAVLDIPGEAAQPGPMRSFWAIRWSRQGSMPTAAALCSWRAALTRRHSRCSGWRIRSRRRCRPVFVWTTMEDAAVPVENTLMLVNALHRRVCPARRICLKRGCTVPASAQQRWTNPAATGITGWNWQWNGWETLLPFPSVKSGYI